MEALSPVVAVHLAPDASLALTVGNDGTVRTWAGGTVTGTHRSSGRIGGGGPAAATLSGQVVTVLWETEGSLRLYRYAPGIRPQHRVFPAPGPVMAVALAPSGNVATAACLDGTLRGLDVRTGEFGWTLATGGPAVRALAMASDDGPVVAAFEDGTICRYRPGTAVYELVGLRPARLHAVAVSADGAVVVTGDDRGSLFRWDSRTGPAPQHRELGTRVITAVAVDRAGDQVLAGGDNGRLWLQDFAGGPGTEYVVPAQARRSGTEAAEAQPPQGPEVRASSSPPFSDDEPSPDGGEPLSDDGEPRHPVDDDVRLTVYRPPILSPDVWAPLLVLMHKTTPVLEPGHPPFDPLAEVEARARAHFGGSAPLPAGEDLPPMLMRGTQLRIVPDLPGIRCNPREAELEWWEPVHEIPFRLAAGQELAGTAVRGAVRVWRGPLILGEVSITIQVAAGPADGSPPVAASARVCRKIFPSYSHRDSAVVKAMQDYVRAMGDGDNYLMDVLDLRSGERWQPGLRELIYTADVFQLFWSRNSMRSPQCREEWEYALSLPREQFVRPVYWEVPLPEDPGQGLPPAALRTLHFAKVPVAGPQPTPPVVMPTASDAVDRLSAAPVSAAAQPPSAPRQEAPPPARPFRSRRPVVIALIALLICAIGVIFALRILG